MYCAPFSLTMQILFASVSYYARSCGFEEKEKHRLHSIVVSHFILKERFAKGGFGKI